MIYKENLDRVVMLEVGDWCPKAGAGYCIRQTGTERAGDVSG